MEKKLKIVACIDMYDEEGYERTENPFELFKQHEDYDKNSYYVVEADYDYLSYSIYKIED